MVYMIQMKNTRTNNRKTSLLMKAFRCTNGPYAHAQHQIITIFISLTNYNIEQVHAVGDWLPWQSTFGAAPWSSSKSSCP